jgi:hypothetical protein
VSGAIARTRILSFAEAAYPTGDFHVEDIYVPEHDKNTKGIITMHIIFKYFMFKRFFIKKMISYLHYFSQPDVS